jgi:photosystem II stability/assembly factor-like uncharacterized protein
MTAKLRATAPLALLLVAGLARSAAANPPPPSEEVPWFPVPLSGGPVHALGLAPGATDLPLLVAGGEEVFTSQRAEAWRAATPRVGQVGSLVVAEGGTVFASNLPTGDGFRSQDPGRSWASVRLRGGEPVHFLTASPAFKSDGVAFAITRNDWRLYRTDKGNTSWIEVLFVGSVAHQTGAVALSPAVRADETVFAGTDRGLYRSTDKGQTWSLLSTAAEGVPAFGAAGGPANGQGIVLPADYGDDPDRLTDPVVKTLFAYNNQGLYRSDDEGATWRKLPLAAGPVRGLAISNGFPADPVLMAAIGGGGSVVAVSTDGGQTWRTVAGPDGVAGTAVAMALDFAVVTRERDPRHHFIHLPIALKHGLLNSGPIPVPPPPSLGSREAYLATDGDGVWRSRDAGLTWSRAWSGLYNAQPTALAFLPGGGDAGALAGTRSGGLYRSLDGGRSFGWLATSLPRGAGQDIAALAVSPAFDRDRTVFLAATSGVWISQDGGLGWRRTPGPAPAGSLSISPQFATDRIVVADTQMSRDGGESWTPVPGATAPLALSPTFATDNTLWAGGERLRRSTDGGATWQDFQTVALLRSRPVFALQVVQVIAGEFRVFLGTDRGIIQSFDNGLTWASAGISTRDVWDLAAQVTQQPQGALVMAAGEDGALWSDNRGVNWTKVPASGKPAWSVAGASDASTVLAATPLRVSRYGYGSGRVNLPVSYR